MPRRFLMFLFCLGLGLGLANALPAWSQVDLCSLIDQKQAASILGAAVSPGQAGTVTGMAEGRKCTIRTSAPIAKAGGVGAITIYLYDKATMAQADGLFKTPRQYYDRLRSTKAKHKGKLEEIPGLGQAAYWESGANLLHVMLKDDYLVLKIQDMTRLSAPNRSQLDQKIAAHRKELSLKAMREYILPKLGK